MNRSVKSLLSVSVLAPVAALTVAAAPANAAPGPSTTLLYETYAAAPVARTLPEPVTQSAGQTAELTTLTVDGVLENSPAGPGARAARCTLNPGKTANSNAGTSLPEAPLSTVDQTPLGALPKGDCLAPASRAGGRSAPNALPAVAGPAGDAVGEAGDLPGRLLGNLNGVDPGLRKSGLGVPGTETVLPAEAPLSMPLADVPSTLAKAEPAGLPVGTTLFPPTERSTRPGPTDDVLGQANGAVNHVGTALDETENGVGQTVEVLKARDRVGGAADGPVSLLTSSGVDLPAGPGLG
ncbi:hypothetical protein E1281_26690 [Actinomadura sp. KC345]|uniref:hypothetical protein n=1 Tax=Actinomadura sp. KC345 TaxID=2530371 RepID=UPI0010515F45|nr:hypothetical protein [Actinomadura sp. KC345]TDC47166.1 hypothetical protein E1281_26690 [Actinomadura sp. KC345]